MIAVLNDEAADGVDARQVFLAGVHVGVLAVGRSSGPPLAVPVWYGYEPGGDVLVWMNRMSVKRNLIARARMFTLVAQTEAPPYQYVSVEGVVVAADEPPTRAQAELIARRYLAEDKAEQFIQGFLCDQSVLIRMVPNRWFSNIKRVPRTVSAKILVE